jgi:Ca2+-transporting ATPase
VEQGRAIFSNIRKFTVYLLSGNMGEILAVGVASVFGLPLPLLPLQILYINVVNDAFPALALGVGEGDPRLMERSPRSRKESILTRSHWIDIIAYGFLIAGTILLGFLLGRSWLGLDETAATTVSFVGLGFTRLWHVFNMREAGSGLLKNEITRNKYVWLALAFCTVLLVIAVYVPGLSDALQTADLSVNSWLLLLAVSFIPLIVGQIVLMVKGGQSAKSRSNKS